MADIILRAADWMGGTVSDLQSLQPDEERYYFRGQALTNVSRGDRVYFVEQGDIGGEGKITGSATYKTYDLRYGDNMTDTGWWGAFIVEGHYVPIDPPEPMPDGYRGQWRARYVHTVPGLVERLRGRTA